MVENQRPSQSHRNRDGKATLPSLRTWLLYGSAGVAAAGFIGYYLHQWFQGSSESEKDDCSVNKCSLEYQTKHYREGEVLKRLSHETVHQKRREAIIHLVHNFEFHFYRNQRISDVTALRSLSTLQFYVNSTFNVMPLTNLLRDNASSLTPADKHHHFNKVKILCFCRMLTSLYILLLRLWLHRIEINILGRQWVPQLISAVGPDVKVSDEDLKMLQDDLELCDTAVTTAEGVIRSPYLDVPAVDPETKAAITKNQVPSPLNMTEIKNPVEFYSSISESKQSASSQLANHFAIPSSQNNMTVPFFQRSRILQYSSRQKAKLYPPSSVTATNSEANYVFLTSTRWLEFEPGRSALPNLIEPIVDSILSDTLPQHLIDLPTLQNLLEQLCNKVEMQLFSCDSHRSQKSSSNNIENHSEEKIDSTQPTGGWCDQEEDSSGSFPLLIVDILVPDSITSFDSPSPSKPSEPTQEQQLLCDHRVNNSISVGLLDNRNKHMENEKTDDCGKLVYNFDTSSLTSKDDAYFVQGCLSETRDILESASFKASFISSRQSFLNKIIDLVSEKLPPVVRDGESFPLCRIFGRLCGVAELLLLEVSEDHANDIATPSSYYKNDYRSTSVRSDNEFAAIFNDLSCVEYLCGAIYLPSIMCPDLLRQKNPSSLGEPLTTDTLKTSCFAKRGSNIYG